MKESHSEGVANHTDPESCGETQEGLAEALTGESTGRAIEPRNYMKLRDADAVSCAEGHTFSTAKRGAEGSREVEDPGTYGRVLHGNREIPGSPEKTSSGRIGKSKDKRR